ncbi:TonB-dependent receptor [Sphingomonas sabuli]|uniref:TonB-dependent receptor n=2 Tax=Sphingomonas sabuli TaxID=2764186 RepID=A0A7G9L5X3_9SPHN|nr:TonB-dependent receptor [Sphingomonas sabuli]
MRKSVWLLSAALFAIPVPAFAQQADPGQPTNPVGPAGEEEIDQANTAGQGAVANTDLSEQPVDTSDIVVTATRRNQALSDVPLAVSAVTAENLQLSGATDIRQLNQLSPSLLVSSTTSEGGAAVARIRGIGTVGDNPGLEGSVGVFIDGVYRSRAGMGLTELGPLERIEVLRGPQGTLFGRNTSAGLISVITAQPRFTPEVSGAISVGNYNLRRLEGSVTGPVADSVAARIDGVWMKRDGFLDDVISGRDVNDRNRWLLRGQLLFEPTDDLSVRIIADYTKRREECCGATYLPARDFAAGGSQPSTIAAIERALGAVINDDTYGRDISISPGRNFDSDVDDYGLSGELNYDFGGAKLTSITAYRVNKYVRGMDADFNNLDILYRDSDGGSYNKFNTFTQELRLNGEAFGGKLDWLVGGYYANEKLRVEDNLSYGNDYGRYSNCLVAANFASSPLIGPAILAPGASPTCFNPAVATGVRNALVGQYLAALGAGQFNTAAALGGQITALGAFAGLDNTNLGPGLPSANFGSFPFGTSGFSNLAVALGGPAFVGSSLNGAALNDSYRQQSNNWSVFTHNIFEIVPGLDFTIGARYTHERKTLDATLLDNNVLCTVLSGSSLQQLPCVIAAAPGGSFGIDDSRTESKLSGTAVLSYKVTPDLLTYISYSRGYKAGGFNLDRSALFRATTVPTTVPATSPTTPLSNPPLSGSGAICVSPLQAGCQGMVASGENLQFKPETNDAIELGAKYNGPGIDVNVAVFNQLFRNFQLNTFNGLNFIVENINACSEDLGGADTDASSLTGACSGKTRAGVRSRGFEIEAFTRPMRYFDLNAGVTYANTKYRDDLVGADGKPLNDYLFQLPGRRISNSSLWTLTGAMAWSPPIGSSGLSALFYVDARHQTGLNTGSDLDIEKYQGGFTVVNGRVGIRGPNNAWSVELWAQNLFNEDYTQVAFDAPIQGSGTQRGVEAGFYPRATQLFGAFLGEPRTFGLTLRAKWSPAPAAPVYVAPPPPPPAPATQTCPDGSVILATEVCPAPPPPPPPPPPAPERG